MKSLGVPSRYVSNPNKSKSKSINKSRINGKKKTSTLISNKKTNNTSYISSSSKLSKHKDSSDSSSNQTLLSIDKRFAEYLDRKEREKIEETLNQRPPWNPTSRRRASVSSESTISSKSATKKKKIGKRKINKQQIKAAKRSSSISNSSSGRRGSISNFDSENSLTFARPSFTSQTSPLSQHSYAAESRERARRSIEKANTFLNQLSDSSSDDEHLLSKPLRNPFIIPHSFAQNRTEEFSFADSTESVTSSDIYRIPEPVDKSRTEADKQRRINQALLADLDDSSENYSSSYSENHIKGNMQNQNIHNQSLQQQRNYINKISNSTIEGQQKVSQKDKRMEQQTDNGLPVYMSRNVKLAVSESFSYATSDALSEEIDQLKSLVSELKDIKNSFIEEQQHSLLSQRREAPLLPLSSSESSDDEQKQPRNDKTKPQQKQSRTTKNENRFSVSQKVESQKAQTNDIPLYQSLPSPKILAASMSSSSSFEEKENGQRSPYRTTFSAIEFDNVSSSSDEEEDGGFETPEELARKIRAHLRNSPYSKAKISSSTQQTEYEEGDDDSSSDEEQKLSHPILLPSVSENDRIPTLSESTSENFDEVPQVHQNFMAANQRRQRSSDNSPSKNVTTQNRDQPSNVNNNVNRRSVTQQNTQAVDINKNHQNLVEEEEEEEEDIHTNVAYNTRQNVVPPLPMDRVDNDIRNDPDYPIRRMEWQRRFDRETSSDMEEESPVVKSPVNPNHSQTSPPHVTIIREAHSSSSSNSDDESAPERGTAFTFLEDSSSDDDDIPLSRKISATNTQKQEQQSQNVNVQKQEQRTISSDTTKTTQSITSSVTANDNQPKNATKKVPKDEDLAEMYSKHQFRLTAEQWNKIFGDSSDEDSDDDNDIDLKKQSVKIPQNNNQTNQKQDVQVSDSDDENSLDDDQLNAIIRRSKRNYVENDDDNDN